MDAEIIRLSEWVFLFFFQIITALTLGHSSLSTVLISALDITAVISSLTDPRITSHRCMVH